MSRLWVGRYGEDDADVLVFDADARAPAPGYVTLVVVTPFEAPSWRASVYEEADFRSKGRVGTDPEERQRACKAYLSWLALESERKSARDRLLAEEKAEDERRSEQARVVRERIDELRALVQAVMQPSECGRSIMSPPIMDVGDIELALCWYHGLDQRELRARSRRPNGDQWLAQEHRENSELTRLLSARAAELATDDFFTQLGYKTFDVAATQTPDATDGEWRRCDLRVIPPDATGNCELALDVKNTRRPRGAHGLATRHVVPAFKLDRRGAGVRVVGVLSPFQWSDVLLGYPAKPGPWTEAPVVVLGWTDVGRLASLVESFDTPGVLGTALVAESARKGSLLPGWAYDAPDELAVGWEQSASVLRRVLASDASARELLGRIGCSQLALAGALAVTPATTGTHLPAGRWDTEFFRQLLIARQTFGRSLPAIVLTILAHFAEQVARQRRSGSATPQASEDSFSPAGYRKLLWASSVVAEREADGRPEEWWEEAQREAGTPGVGQFPLGVYDPLRTVAALVSALDILWTADHGAIRDYTAITVRGWNILTAEHRPTGERRTILTYCGGWSLAGPCGNFPLVLGESRHCAEGRLECARCGYCCHICRPDLAPRRSRQHE